MAVFQAIFWGLVYLAAVGLAACTTLGFLARLWWVFDLFSHFRLHYLAGLSAVTLLCVLGRKTEAAAVSGIFAAINLALVAPLYLWPGRSWRKPKGRRTYQVLVANILKVNNHYAKVADLIRQEQPDFIALVEVDQTWMSELKDALAPYPYGEMPVREDNYGVALLSRFPLDGVRVQNFSDARVPSIVAHLQLDSHPLTLICTHPPPPKSAIETRQRDQQMAQIAEFVSAQDGEVMVLGDLNLTSWSPVLLAFLSRSRLRESRRGFGVQASWPADNPLLRVPIDHALVSKGISIHRRRVGPNVGSDHLPVLVDFSFKEGR